MGFFSKDTIGIDPGSQHLRIIKDGSLVFNEPSKISIDRSKGAVSGLGNAIRLTEKDTIIKPIDYTITDFHGFEMLLRGAIKKGFELKSLFPRAYKMYFSLASNSTEIDKRAYRDSAEHCNAAETYMVYQNCCSAVGMNILLEKKHFLLIDFGSSKIELTIFGESLPISIGFIKMGISKIIRLIKNFFLRKHKLNVDDNEIVSMLKTLGGLNLEEVITIQNVIIKKKEIQELLIPIFSLVNDEFIEAIERVDNHAAIGKAITNGAHFTGGGSTIEFLRDQIKLGEGIKRIVSQNALLDNINGLNKVMTERNKFKEYILQ